jgi:hypothetical protein
MAEEVGGVGDPIVKSANHSRVVAEREEREGRKVVKGGKVGKKVRKNEGRKEKVQSASSSINNDTRTP